MIEAMRILALEYLVQQLAGEAPPDDSEAWYSDLRARNPGKLFPYLVEDSGKVEMVYIISEESEDLAAMSVEDVIEDNASETVLKLPFIKPSGNRSPAAGPIIKRTYSREKGGGPTDITVKTYMDYFLRMAQSNEPWGNYFREIVGILQMPNLRLVDGSVLNWAGAGYRSLLSCAIDKIGPQKNTVFLTVRDGQGRLPGEVKQYVDYLMAEKLAGERYVTLGAQAREDAGCPLCGAVKITTYPNALKGAGINLTNVDRAGLFPGIDVAEAWKRYSLCGACADLLYTYKFHVLKKAGPDKKIQPFSAMVAGEKALIIPSFSPGLSPKERQEFLDEVSRYIGKIEAGDIEEDENYLMEIIKDYYRTVFNLVILWADLGQNIENVTGMIVNVLPSRLRELSIINAEVRDWQHSLFPAIQLRGRDNFQPDLALSALRPLFRRPGGKKVNQLNESGKLFQIKRQIAECVYHGKQIPDNRFWDEVMITARSYWMEAVEKGDGYNLLNEGWGKRGAYLTAAGWIRHCNWWIYYFKRLGVLAMPDNHYMPGMETLKPYFGPESGIDSREKAYSFLLGVLYGKLLQVQGARGVNVGSNALTWLKRLTLRGKDLPGLYIKIREKLMAYGTEANEEVRQLISEIGVLGISLGDNIELDETQANYYLLLGQSMTNSILSKK